MTPDMRFFCNSPAKCSKPGQYSLGCHGRSLIGNVQQILRTNARICLGDFLLRRLWLLAAVLCGGIFAPAVAAIPSTPVGTWLTADRSAVVRVAACGTGLCGQIVGIALAHPGDAMPLNWRGQPQCGEIIVQAAPALGGNGITRWVGTVLDPRDGDVYQASIALDANRNLRMHGYLGLPLFGETQTWTPYSGRITLGCKLAHT